jgi:hypothetical protein
MFCHLCEEDNMQGYTSTNVAQECENYLMYVCRGGYNFAQHEVPWRDAFFGA